MSTRKYHQTINDSSSYSYDATNQLTATDHSYQTDEAYSYDANGNRTNSGYVTGTNNRLTNDGTFSYTYDHRRSHTLYLGSLQSITIYLTQQQHLQLPGLEIKLKSWAMGL